MSVATLNKVNQELSQMAKNFSHSSSGSSKTITGIKKLISVSTTKESVKNSAEILEDVMIFIKKLPVTDAEIKAATLKSNIAKANNNIQFVSKILSDIQETIDNDGAKIKVDDNNMKTFIANLYEVKKYLLEASDYLNLVSQIQAAKKEIKEGNFKDYTLEELLEKLKAA